MKTAERFIWNELTEFKGPLPGFLSDTYGPRIPMLIGSLLHVFGLMMTSLSRSYYQFFLAQSVCSALGCCFLFFPCTHKQIPLRHHKVDLADNLH